LNSAHTLSGVQLKQYARPSAGRKPAGAAARAHGDTPTAHGKLHERDDCMSLIKYVGVMSLAGVVLVASPAREASAGPQAATPAAAKIDDSALQSQIAANLKKSAALAPRSIDVDVKEGVVTLTGTVRTTSEKTSAGRLAKAPGVARVDNKIKVDPKVDQSKIDTAGDKTKAGAAKAVDATVEAGHKTTTAVEKGAGKTEQGVGKAADKTAEAVGKAGDKTTDTSITTRVKAGFSGDKALRGVAIAVTTTDHVVTLKGTIASNEVKTHAAEVAGAVGGVTRVDNQLVVKDK
jgi:hyperosmotically inducible periplasmic protein